MVTKTIFVLDSISFKMATHMATLISYFTFSDFWRFKDTLLIKFSFSHQANTTKTFLKSLERSRNQRNVGKKIVMFLNLVGEREMICSLSGRGWGERKGYTGEHSTQRREIIIFFLILFFLKTGEDMKVMNGVVLLSQTSSVNLLRNL